MASVQRDFHHPYTPYDIQIQFMNAVYDCLEHGKIGILESPTGTGKTLSLICGSLTWLRDFRKEQFQASVERGLEDDADEPDWLVANAKKQRQDAALRRREERQAKLKRIRLSEEHARLRYESGESMPKRQKTKIDASSLSDDEQAEYLLDNYQSEDEHKVSTSSNSALSAETQALLEKLGHPLSKSNPEDDEAVDDETKIFFCSRTHSQLSQFVHELRRTRMPSGIAADDMELEEVKHVTLGSRKQLCINPKVLKLKNVGAMNERCLEMQQSKTSINSKCAYLPRKDNQVLSNDFRDHILAKIKDIEDLGELGKKIGICPYYASRSAVKPAEIVTLPYPLLLQKSAREALGISLKGHVVIIDEAHNLLDSISSIHSVSITLSQLHLARLQVSTYLDKFSKRLNSKNRVYLGELIRLIDSLTTCLVSKRNQTDVQECQVSIGDLLQGKGADQINLSKLMIYLQESKLARKVERYVAHQAEESTRNRRDSKRESYNASSTPVLTHIHSFLLALTNPATEGRFFLSKISAPSSSQQEDVILKYILLDPTHHFKEIVEDAKAVILAGGTMSPMSDYTDHLFHYLSAARITTLSCGHIIPESKLLVMPVSKGPKSTEFDFTFEKRNSKDMITDLGLSIIQLSRAIPDGLVVFFPSHAYLNQVIQTWQTSNQSIWDQLSERKKIFQEPKATAPNNSNPSNHTSNDLGTEAPLDEDEPRTPATAEQLLQDYAAHIERSKTNGTARTSGAILLAVIGGSLSEGINFSDRLGRGIVVVGLPYPNAKSAEWKAKLEHVKSRSQNRSVSAEANARDGAAAAREYYENACMRAVNQSIGRAIRHKADYATILLFDRRFERDHIQRKLPGWIRRSFRNGDKNFDDISREVGNFFAEKKHAVP